MSRDPRTGDMDHSRVHLLLLLILLLGSSQNKEKPFSVTYFVSFHVWVQDHTATACVWDTSNNRTK